MKCFDVARSAQELPRRAQSAAQRTVNGPPMARRIGVFARKVQGLFHGHGHLVRRVKRPGRNIAVRAAGKLVRVPVVSMPAAERSLELCLRYSEGRGEVPQTPAEQLIPAVRAQILLKFFGRGPANPPG